MATLTRVRTNLVTASETDFSSGVRYVRPAYETTLNALLVRRASFQVTFANYTAVVVKAQVQIDGTNWQDISGATTSTSGDIVGFDVPPCRQFGILVTATLSGSADTLTLDIVEDVE